MIVVELYKTSAALQNSEIRRKKSYPHVESQYFRGSHIYEDTLLKKLLRLDAPTTHWNISSKTASISDMSLFNL